MALRLDNEAAWLLEARPYRETSLLVEVLTERHGRLGLVAQGARGASRGQGLRRALLEPFRPLRLSAAGAGELLTLRAVEADGMPQRPVGDPLFAALYVNELVQRLTGRGDPVPELFRRYRHWLAQLAALPPGAAATLPLAWSLRRFERDLLAQAGYALALERDEDGAPLDPQGDYAFDPDQGAGPWSPASPWPRVRGEVLLAWAGEQRPGPTLMAALRNLSRRVIAHRLDGAALRSLRLAAQWRLRRGGAGTDGGDDGP